MDSGEERHSVKSRGKRPAVLGGEADTGFRCPRCRVPLLRRRAGSLGLVWVCPSCRGRAVTLQLIRKAVQAPLVNAMWQRARSGRFEALRPCPGCRRHMVEVPVSHAAGKVMQLDVCTGCHFVWFDPGELESLPKLPRQRPKPETLTMEEREARAMINLEAFRAESSKAELQDGPDAWWEFAVALCGVPVEYNDMPLQHRPIVTWLLAALIAIVSVIAFFDLESAIRNWGLIPAQFGRHFGLTFITSFLLHGSVFHLLANLYYLVVFGDNTEDVLGKGRYLFLIALAALVGDVAHILLEPRADIPAIGASGGISGVLAYYCLRFPRANVGLVWWFHWFRLPVGVMFALWVVFQLVEAVWIRQGGATGVAVFAHLGGAAVGVAFWLTTRRAMASAARSDASVA